MATLRHILGRPAVLVDIHNARGLDAVLGEGVVILDVLRRVSVSMPQDAATASALLRNQFDDV